MIVFAHSYSFWYVLLHIHVDFIYVSFLNSLHASATEDETLPT